MIKFILIFIVVITFNSCGGGGDSSTVVEEVITENTSMSCTDALEPTVSYYSQQWSIIKDINFYNANSINSDAHINATTSLSTYNGNTITVAIIDNGFDINHPEIKDRIFLKKNFTNIGISTDVSQNDGENHGTAVAGIIASKSDSLGIRGISPNVNLILIKMPELLSLSTIIDMFDYAVDNGADIINCSWGTNSVLDSVRDHLNDLAITGRDGKGVITVFAAGNDNSIMSNDESSISGVIGVGATNRDNLRTTYSNYGKELDLVSPGGEYLGITTIDPLGICGASDNDYNQYDETNNGSYVSFVGTSASAPILSGALALVLEANPSLTLNNIQDLLKSSCDTIGETTPYLDEMITSSSSTPTITGILGTNNFSNFNVRLTNESTNIQYGDYGVSTSGNEWNAIVTDTLPEAYYTIELVSVNNITIWATIEHFEVNHNKSDLKYTTKRKSDYYGYGKLNLDNLIQNSLSF